MPYDRSAAHIFGIFGRRGSNKSESRLGGFPGVWGFSCSFFVFLFFFSLLGLGLRVYGGGHFWGLGGLPGVWVFFVPSLFLLVHYFLLVLGLGFRGVSSYFGDLGGFPGVFGSCWLLFVPFLIFLFLSSSWWFGWFSWGLGVFLVLGGLPVFVFLFFLLGGGGGLFLSCFFLFLFFCFGRPGWFSWGFGFFLFLPCLLFFFLFFLVLGGLGGFPGVWGCSCSFLVFLLVPFLLAWRVWVVFLGFGGFFLFLSSFF